MYFPHLLFVTKQTSSRNSLLTHVGLLPYLLSAQWSGLVLCFEEVVLEDQQGFMGPFGFLSCVQ